MEYMLNNPVAAGSVDYGWDYEFWYLNDIAYTL